MRVVLQKRPDGLPRESDFGFVEEEVPRPGAGEVLVEVAFVAIFPGLRTRLSTIGSYGPRLELGDTLLGTGTGIVVESADPSLAPGDWVEGSMGWQTHVVVPAGKLRRIAPEEAQSAIGLGGTSSLAAYFGLIDVGRATPGDTVLVSGAAGAVGQVVGQIAAIMGCEVIGLVGSDDKARYLLDDLGFDHAVNYRDADFAARLSEVCRESVDVYFDNVGGDLCIPVWRQLATHARVAVCGQVAAYNSEDRTTRADFFELVVRKATVQGFQVFDYQHRYPQARARLTKWNEQGRLRYEQRVVDGVASAPGAFIEMLEGTTTGKTLVRVGEK